MKILIFLFLSLPAVSGHHQNICDVYFRSVEDYQFAQTPVVDLDKLNLNELERFKVITPRMMEILAKSSQRDFFIYLINKNNFLDERIVRNLFEYFNEKQIVYILEYAFFGKKVRSWSSLLNSNNSNPHRRFVNFLNSLSDNQDAWLGLKTLSGVDYSKSKMQKTINFILAMQEENRAGRKLAVNVLESIGNKRLSKNELNDILKAELEKSINLKYIGSQIKFNFKAVIAKIMKRNQDNALNLGLSVQSLLNIYHLPKKKLQKTLDQIKELREVYPLGFIDTLFQSIRVQDTTNLTKQLEDLKKLKEDEYFDKRLFRVLQEINWSKVPVSVFHKIREVENNDGVLVILRVLDNFLKYSFLKNKKTTLIIKEFDKVFSRFEEFEHVIGIEQLLAEIGSKSDKNNDKFRGAFFTFEYFDFFLKKNNSFFKNIFRKTKVLGFEVPIFLVKNKNGKFEFLMQTHFGHQRKWIRFKKNGSQELLDEEKVKISKTIIMYGHQRLNIVQKRKADFVYEKNKKIYIKEMKNYSKDIMGIRSLERELVFDFLMTAYLGSQKNMNIQWVFNQTAFQESTSIKDQNQLETVFTKLINRQIFQSKLNKLKFKKEEIGEVVEYFSSFQKGIEFFSPHVDTYLD